MAAKKIDPLQGRAALVSCLNVDDAQSVDRRTWGTAVRYGLQELAACAPGRSVEVRVPPFGAVQMIEGTTHRRGTPPSVVEMPPAVFLALLSGRSNWESAISSGQVQASGQRCDLSPYLPLI
ncbi:sterol carrier family protein [Actinomyces vulturis]|uniref:sterol carrier family protein n=1 Tax=Actinomyces vulturis TaxID=1857645 RepID=UPI0008367F88|nr:sterol carrier family protein [Actinomyces vulturis]